MAKRGKRPAIKRKITDSKFNERCRECAHAMVLRTQNDITRTFACPRCGEVRVITK